MIERSDDDYKSKSLRKREHHALQALGSTLVTLPLALLQRIPLSELSLEAIDSARQLQRGALQRQLRRLAALLEEEDEGAIRQALAEAQAPAQLATRRFHALEQFRADLITGGTAVIERLLTKYPAANRIELKQLVETARSTVPSDAARAQRRLFKVLSSL